MKSRRLIAIDPSLTCSGWALFQVSSGQLLAVGKIRALPAGSPLAVRLADLQEKIRRVLTGLKLTRNDVLICEAPTTMKDPRAAIKVEQVRSIFEAIARERRLNVPGRLNPRSVQYEVMGLRGRQLSRQIVKATALQIAEHLYGRSLQALGFRDLGPRLQKHQDIVDAMLIGTLAVARVRTAQLSSQSLEELFEERKQTGRTRKHYGQR